MGQVIVDDNSLSAIASAIRTKLNVTTTYTPSEMASAISQISGGQGTIDITAEGDYNVESYAEAHVAIARSGFLDISKNGTYAIPISKAGVRVGVPSYPQPSGTVSITSEGEHNVSGYATANVSIARSGSRSITANGQYEMGINDRYVTVAVPTGITPSGTKSITSNGDYDVSSYAKVSVAVPTSSSSTYGVVVASTGQGLKTGTSSECYKWIQDNGYTMAWSAMNVMAVN